MNVIATSSIHEIFFGNPAIESYRRFATGKNQLGTPVIIKNVRVPEPIETQPETEQTFTRKERKAYRQAVKFSTTQKAQPSPKGGKKAVR